jgi:hypothetical protein
MFITFSCVAQVCPNEFTSYYGQFMPGIKSILVEAKSPELLELRGKAMECAGLIGEAVGVKNFSQDAREVVHIFMEALVRLSFFHIADCLMLNFLFIFHSV